MNVPEIHAFADFVETLPHLTSRTGGHAFDLAPFFQEHAVCRTVGCFAGPYYVLRRKPGQSISRHRLTS